MSPLSISFQPRYLGRADKFRVRCASASLEDRVATLERKLASFCGSIPHLVQYEVRFSGSHFALCEVRFSSLTADIRSEPIV